MNRHKYKTCENGAHEYRRSRPPSAFRLGPGDLSCLSFISESHHLAMKAGFVFLALAASAAAQKVTIASPTENAEVTAGGTLLVEIDRPVRTAIIQHF